MVSSEILYIPHIMRCKYSLFLVFSSIWKWLSDDRNIFDYRNFPFDTSTPLPESASKTLLNVLLLLKNFNSNFRFTDGTALGLYREGKFIAGDNDIDIDLLNFTRPLNLIIKFLTNGFSIGRFVYAKKHVQQISFFDKSNVVVDIIFWRENKSTQIVNYVEPDYIRTQDVKHFYNKTFLMFNGEVIPLPGDIENWLVSRYGDDWRTPKGSNVDWKSYCNDIAPI